MSAYARVLTWFGIRPAQGERSQPNPPTPEQPSPVTVQAASELDSINPRRWQLWTALALFLAGVCLWAVQVAELIRGGCLPSPAIHLADDTQAVKDALSAGTTLCVGSPSPLTAELAAHWIQVSWWFTVGSSLVMLAVFWWGAQLLYGAGNRRLCRYGAAAVAVLFVVDAAENVLSVRGLNDLGRQDRALELGVYAAVLKYAISLPLWVVSITVFGTLAGRLGLAILRKTSRVDFDDNPAADVLVAPPRWEASLPASLRGSVTSVDALAPRPRQAGTDRWARSSPRLPTREPAEVAIAASGGGIRSAILNLGALQEFREQRTVRDGPSILHSARYLVSVSGGGYATGAFQLALCPPRDPGPGEPPPPPFLGDAATVLAPGSVEEDHVRRHANYIADTASEWSHALLQLLRGVVASLGLLALVVVLLGMTANLFYRIVPVICLADLRPRYDATSDGEKWTCTSDMVGLEDYSPPFPDTAAPAMRILLYLAVATAAVALLRLALKSVAPAWTQPGKRILAQRLSRVSRYVAYFMLVWLLATAAYVVVLPAILWVVTWLSYNLPGVPGPGEVDPGVAASVVTFLTWLAALASALWRTVVRVLPSGEKMSRFKKSVRSVESAVGTSIWLRLVVAAVLVVVAFFYIQIFAVMATTSDDMDPFFAWYVGGLVLLTFVWIVVDQTWLSLHPFYRRRLATAFAVRRLEGASGPRAVAYDKSEMTPLEDYGKRHETNGVPDFPQVIFAAAAAVSGHLAPPGRRVVGWTFGSDYVGGPDVGYVETSTYTRTASTVIAGDLTVQAAMAISGAAIASSMGRLAGPTQRLFALSNLRLGTWLPNPRYLMLLAGATDQQHTWMPRLPHVRRLKYHLREVLGAFGGDQRMLLVTDGGHYENLGLVETLRIGSRVIFVIDGTADQPPFPSTLGDAVALAREELGVDIRFDAEDLRALVPGSATPLEPTDPLAGLSARMSKSCVAVGTIKYPTTLTTEEGEEFNDGIIIFAKAAITPDLPLDLLTYALHETTFPRMSTADQWFNHRQFDAYHELGRCIAKAAARAYRDSLLPESKILRARVRAERWVSTRLGRGDR